MKSQNFEFLRSKWPELAGLGGFAETCAHTDVRSPGTTKAGFDVTMLCIAAMNLMLHGIDTPDYW